MRFGSCCVTLALFLAGFGMNARTEAEDDTREQLKALQEQMKAMSLTLEDQKKKIANQDRTIQEMKSKTAQIEPGPLREGAGNGERPSGAQGQGTADAPKKGPGERMHSWEFPPIVVTAERPSELREEERIGEYGQPRWTARRRFAETRSYVIPKGQIEIEYWNVVEVPRKGDTEVETKYEVEMGLPYRFQLDLYAIAHEKGHVGLDKQFKFDTQQVELRWAWADWNKIPGNPTSYFEYIAIDGEPDHFETKLLFSGEAAPRVHWAANLVWEHQLGGNQENTYELTGGIAYSVKDEKLSLGIESKLAYTDDKFRRGIGRKDPELLVGPSVQFRPLKQMHIDFAALAGVTQESPRFKSLLIFGWEF